MISTINGITTTYPDSMNIDEATKYVCQEQKNWGKAGREIDKITIWLDDAYVMVKADEKSPITRIRRITGYLSNINNFNDAKRAELAVRECHYLNDNRE